MPRGLVAFGSNPLAGTCRGGAARRRQGRQRGRDAHARARQAAATLGAPAAERRHWLAGCCATCISCWDDLPVHVAFVSTKPACLPDPPTLSGSVSTIVPIWQSAITAASSCTCMCQTNKKQRRRLLAGRRQQQQARSAAALGPRQALGVWHGFDCEALRTKLAAPCRASPAGCHLRTNEAPLACSPAPPAPTPCRPARAPPAPAAAHRAPPAPPPAGAAAACCPRRAATAAPTRPPQFCCCP